MQQVVVAGVFAHREAARAGIERLLESGVLPERIHVLAPEAREAVRLAEQMGALMLRGGLAGLVLGVVAGGLMGCTAAAGVAVLPGAGVVLALGPLGAAVAGGVLGGAAGALVGLLLSLASPRGAVAELQRELTEGRIVVLAEAVSEAASAEAALYAAGALGVRHFTRTAPERERERRQGPRTVEPGTEGIGVPFGER